MKDKALESGLLDFQTKKRFYLQIKIYVSKLKQRHFNLPEIDHRIEQSDQGIAGHIIWTDICRNDQPLP